MQPDVYIFTDVCRPPCRYCMLFTLCNSTGGSITLFVWCQVSCVFLWGYGTKQSITEAHHQGGWLRLVISLKNWHVKNARQEKSGKHNKAIQVTVALTLCSFRKESLSTSKCLCKWTSAGEKNLTTLPFKCLVYYQIEDSLPLFKKWQAE